MGKERLKDGSLHPLTVPTALSPFAVTQRKPGDLGFLPIGVYKGAAAFWDLDKAVNLPLVWAEQQHILGILDGREEDYDQETLTTVIGDAVGTAYSGSLTVPSGDVWYLNAVQVILNTTGGAQGLTGNWRCSIWPCREDPASENGQKFYATDLTQAANDTTTWLAEFGPIATAWLITNKTVLLRLPTGTKITFRIVTTTAQVDAAVASTIRLKGFRTRALVA